MSEALHVEGLSVRRPEGGPAVVDPLDLELAPGQILAVVGESGCGKSSLLRALCGLLPRGWAATGTARLGGTDLLRLRGDEWCAVRGARIGVVFQEPQRALDPTRRVLSLVEVAYRHRPAAQRRAAALQGLARVGFPEPERRGHAFPHELSGGLRQRVLIALALARAPELVLADEPTSHLDPTLQAQILGLLRAHADEARAKVLLVTHDVSVVEAVADRVAVMYAGRLVEAGATQDILQSPRHPYTAGLLAARPRPGELPTPIPGEVPRLDAPPPGCRFHPRCAAAEDDCRVEAPAMGPVGKGRVSACHHPRAPEATP